MHGAESASEPLIPDGTASLLEILAQNPTADVRCSLARQDPAVAIYHTPAGCAARPGDRFQGLCLQHIETDGINGGSKPILDLTEGQAWSKWAGIEELPLRLGYGALELSTFLESLETQP